MKRATAAALVLLGSACTTADADATQRAVEGAVEGFFISIIQWFLVMFLIAVLAVVTWSLLIGGAAAAIVAGLRRVRAGDAPPRAAEAEPASTGAPGTYDALGIGMTVFGIVLLLSSIGTVCSVTAGPTGAEASIPVPLIVLGAALVLGAKRRARDRARPQERLPR